MFKLFSNFIWMSFIFSISLVSFANDEKPKKILLNQVSKTFTLETDPAVIKNLKAKPWEAKKKQIESLDVKLNDSIVFYNADDFVHNVYSSFFDLKTQEPKKSSEVVFDKVGTFEVQCAIHPKMKIQVKVTK